MMRRAMPLPPVIALLGTLTCALPAGAEWFDNYFGMLSQNTMIMPPATRRAMAEAAARVRSGAGDGAMSAPADAFAATLSASDFRPVSKERDKVIESLLAGLSAGPERDALRARLDTYMTAVENVPAGRRYNLAEMTGKLIGISFLNANGRPLDTTQSQQLMRALAAAYAADAGFAQLDNLQRNDIYYVYAARTVLTSLLSQSQDPAQSQAGKDLARGTLREFGMQP